MVIVVTGASGMVGSQIVLALIEAGMGPVRGLYRSAASLESARRSWEFQGFEARWDEVEWVRTDLEDPTAVEAALEGADYAVHTAALVSYRKNDEQLMLRGTPLMAEYVVNGALHHGLKGLIHISSVAVLQGSEMPLDESADPQRKGLNAYARSKFDAEMQARRGEAEGLRDSRPAVLGRRKQPPSAQRKQGPPRGSWGQYGLGRPARRGSCGGPRAAPASVGRAIYSQRQQPNV